MGRPVPHRGRAVWSGRGRRVTARMRKGAENEKSLGELLRALALLVHITMLPEVGRRGIICIRGMRKKPRRFPEPRQKPGRTRRPRQPYYHDSPPVVKLRRAVFCYILLHDEVLRAIEEPPNLTGS